MQVLDSALVRRVRQSPRLRPPAIAAYRLMDRLTPAPPGPRVVANSMPKSGTHLLSALLDQIEGMRFSGRIVMYNEAHRHISGRRLKQLDSCLDGLRSSHYFGAHLIRDEQVETRVAARDVKMITMIRDPRAVIASALHYVQTAQQLKRRQEILRVFPDQESVVRGLVVGHGRPGDRFYFPEIGSRFASYVAWADSPLGMTVRFEDIVGGRGGGSDDEQVRQVASVLRYLGHATPTETASVMAGRLFSERAITFRAGVVDSWKQDIPARLISEIEDRCADSMHRMGYSP